MMPRSREPRGQSSETAECMVASGYLDLLMDHKSCAKRGLGTVFILVLQPGGAITQENGV